jgi:hypothetical protein
MASAPTETDWPNFRAQPADVITSSASLHIAPPGRQWQLSLVGGPTFHPTNSNRSTDALRDLPARGYAFKMSFSASF